MHGYCSLSHLYAGVVKAFNTAGFEQPTASGSLKSTGSENGHPVVPPSRFASSSVEAPSTPPQPSMTAPADRVRPADSRDSLGAQSSKSLGSNSISKPPLPGLTDPTKSRELRQLPLVAGAQRDSKDSFKSPWETSGGTSHSSALAVPVSQCSVERILLNRPRIPTEQAVFPLHAGRATVRLRRRCACKAVASLDFTILAFPRRHSHCLSVFVNYNLESRTSPTK